VKTLPEWQQAAHALFAELGEYWCTACGGIGDETMVNAAGDSPEQQTCRTCHGTGRRELTPTFIAARLALIHLEISRAVECVLKGELKFDWHADLRMPFLIDVGDSPAQIMAKCWKPAGFPPVLATVFLRMCDLAEALGIAGLRFSQERRNARRLTSVDDILTEMNTLHMLISQVLPRVHSKSSIQGVLNQLGQICAYTGVEMEAMASLKLDWWMRQGTS
jgi:hypothetical protein